MKVWREAGAARRRHKRSLVVLTDDRPSWRPNAYRSERWDFAHILRFPMVKVLDFRERWAELETTPNPFALVAMAHLETQAAAELEGVTPMPYVTSIERLAKAEGKAEGLREGLLEAIDLGLELRFGKDALQVLPRVRGIVDLDRLRGLKAALTRVASITEFESLLARS